MLRPRLRPLFVDGPRRTEVSFYTSSVEKFLQARLVLQEYGLMLRHFLESQEPYDEDYSLGKTGLLTRAIAQIKARLGVNSLFFVEDTSVIIHALSSSDKPVPGLEVKEWFARTSFAGLDNELRKRGNSRAATVCSDIALHVPGLENPVFFHGATRGRVADSPPEFAASDQHPWLTPNTFNGWFIPDASSKRLGEMSYEESLDFDFRVKSLAALADRLEEYAAVLNYGGHSYSVRRPRGETSALSLFKEPPSLLIVVGKTCAGKTTMGQYAASRHAFRLIEASSMMRLAADRVGVSGPDAYYRAKALLQEKGPDIVAREIVGSYGDDLANRAIITGFRTIEEIQYIRGQFPGCKVIQVDASERTRFERHLRRGRTNAISTLAEFTEHDRQQSQFGLLSVAAELADVRITNEGTMKEFHAQIDTVMETIPTPTQGVSYIRPNPTALKQSRLFRCLRALEQVEKAASCPEIAQLTDRDTPMNNMEQVERISPRHVNWVLKDVPELARRVDARGDRVRYQILPAGRAYLEAVRAMTDQT